MPERSRSIRGALCRSYRVPSTPQSGEHVCSIPGFACFFPVKAFWLCVSAAPHSPGWALCIGSAACQDPGGVASVFSLQPLLSLCPRKLEKHAGKNAMRGGGEGGKTPEPGEGCRAPPAARRLPGAWSATMEAASVAGSCRAQECHTTVTTAISCRRHTLVLAGPPKLPE